MGTCSANLHKISGNNKVTLTLEPIAKEASFDIDERDVRDAGDTVEANHLAFSEKVFVPFTVLGLVYYMLQRSTGYSTSS